MIAIQNLNFAYKRKKIFTGLSLTLQPGHIYGLLGKNGTGKSTLLRNIAGMLFPTSGSVTVNNYVAAKRQPDFLQDIFMVPEEFFLPNVSIGRFASSNAPFYPKFSQEQFDKYLKEFDIPLSNTLQNMSYGQKKKVLISFGLACNTSVLLMDEPTNGLDIMSKGQFRKVIASSLDENKMIVISTHQVKDLENLIDRITIIDEGQILFDQTIESITNKLHFGVAFNEHDATNALYKEESIKGYTILSRNEEQLESKLDLEILYKAIVLNGEAVRNVFQNQ